MVIIFVQRSSSIDVCPPSKTCFNSNFIFHQRLFSSMGVLHGSCLPSENIFHQRLSSIKGYPPSKVILHQRVLSIKGCIPLKVVFQDRLSSVLSRAGTNTISVQSHELNLDWLELSLVRIIAICKSLEIGNWKIKLVSQLMPSKNWMHPLWK